MKKILRNIVPLLLLVALSAEANLVGLYVYYVKDDVALQVSLSDTKRAGAESSASECEKKGMYRVLMEATDKYYYPQMVQYASGCWYAQGSQIFIAATTVEDSSPLNLRAC